MNQIDLLSLEFQKISLDSHKSVIKIQSLFRGYIIRKSNANIEDSMNKDNILSILKRYKDIVNLEKEINSTIEKNSKKIRITNMPSHITENIVKYAFYKKYKLMPSWDTKVGDLIVNKCNLNLKLEVKGSFDLNRGPMSFGPTENWDFIYFVNMQSLNTDFIIIYELKINNNDKRWKKIKVNKKQTIEDQCLEKRRPRIVFKQLYEQLSDKITILFSGNLYELFSL